LLGGIVVVFSVFFFDRIKVDDPVGAISVHGVCGALGTLLLGLFHKEQGLFYGGGFKFLSAQVVGVISVFAWCMATGFALFFALKAIMGLRVSEEEEAEGLDYGEHSATAYPDFSVSAVGRY
jgi:Amt family ammonium transporter